MDSLARELASEKCVRCAKLPDWKTAALIYMGSKLDYFYCYQCRRWFVRDAKYRYATSNLDEPDAIRRLLAILKLRREMVETQIEGVHWIWGRLSDAGHFLWKFIKWGSARRP